ncbi:MAG: phenylphosphate carboxylase subunit delta [Deferrisomatales bacterium]|nr:phenylphosphate carboxylase subunit delta [Deferrisomatales bacterium]
MTLEQRLAAVELLLLDVDGVLTDGRIMIDDAGVETKAFDVTDGHGLKLLQRAGVEVGLVTGRRSRVVEHRARELGICEVHQGVKDKLPVVRAILARRGLTADRLGYVGDDVVDLPVLLQAALAVSVPDAPSCVRERVHWVTERPGGRGAVREVCEALLRARGAWEGVTAKYFSPERQ